jgi:DNA-binding transcriptional LysR family regulator
MLDYLRPLAIFAKTAEFGSFRGAAAALKLSPSVVSHHISQLEAQLGVALIYRSTRRLSLTHEGTLLFGAASRMTAAAEDALSSVLGRTGKPVGQLRVTVSAVMARSPFFSDIAAFAKAYPGVVLDLSFAGVQRDIISDGIDVAMRLGVGPMADSSLKVRRLASVPRLLVGAAEYVADKTVPNDPDDLVGWDWLRLAPFASSMQFHHKSREPVTVNFAPVLTSDGVIALHQILKEGLGITALPDFIVEADLAEGTVVNVLPEWQPEAMAVFLVSPPTGPRDSLQGFFMDFLEERVRARKTGNG